MLKRALSMLAPESLRRRAQTAQTMWALGALRDPLAFLRQWRHRHDFVRLQKALFYHRFATAILIAQELGLYDALRDGACTPAELAGRCGIDPRGVDSLTRILESQGVVERSGPGIRLTEFGQLYFPSTGAHSVAPMLDFMSVQAACFTQVADGLRTGRSARSLDIFDEAGNYRVFLGAVNAYLRWASRDLLYRARLPEVRRLLVGSMGVSFSAEVMSRFAGSRVTYGCLAHLAREIPRLREEYAVPATRVEGTHAHGGEPEADPWGEGSFDLVLLTKKMILDPDRQLGDRFARKALSVLSPGGVTVLWETIHPDDSPTPLSLAMEGVLDLASSPIAPVQTERALRERLLGIGYGSVEVVPCLDGQTTFVVARR